MQLGRLALQAKEVSLEHQLLGLVEDSLALQQGLLELAFHEICVQT